MLTPAMRMAGPACFTLARSSLTSRPAPESSPPCPISQRTQLIAQERIAILLVRADRPTQYDDQVRAHDRLEHVVHPGIHDRDVEARTDEHGRESPEILEGNVAHDTRLQ